MAPIGPRRPLIGTANPNVNPAASATGAHGCRNFSANSSQSAVSNTTSTSQNGSACQKVEAISPRSEAESWKITIGSYVLFE